MGTTCGLSSFLLPFIIPNFARSSCPPSPFPFFPPTRYLSCLRQLSPPPFWSILVFPFVSYLFQWSQSGYTAINAIRKLLYLPSLPLPLLPPAARGARVESVLSHQVHNWWRAGDRMGTRWEGNKLEIWSPRDIAKRQFKYFASYNLVFHLVPQGQFLLSQFRINSKTGNKPDTAVSSLQLKNNTKEHCISK